MPALVEIPIDQVPLRSDQANDQVLSASGNPGIVFSGAGGGIPGDFLLRARFNELARRWKKETAHISSATKTAMHPAYQAIIGMGEKALPLIFANLRDEGGHWFWALNAITQEDPAHGCDDFATAARIWLDWAQAQGFVR